MILATALAAPGIEAHRFDHREEDEEHDHDRARQALMRGEVRPLAEVLRQVSARVPGEVIAVEFERERRGAASRWVYEVKLIRPNGRLIEVYVDAASGEILKSEDE